MQLKLEIHQACAHMLDEKITALQSALKDLQQGAENDSKSTAGDKHETARAMMQLEQEHLGKQLHALLLQKKQLDQLQPADPLKVASSGALIETDKGLFYLSTALGKIQTNTAMAIALSPQSPLGAKWIGKKAGDKVTMNTMEYVVQMVC